MQTRWILTLALALGMAATPALAGHRHRSGCGHAYSRAHGGWVTIDDAPGGGARVMVDWPSEDLRPD